MEVNIFIRDCLAIESVLNNVPQWLAHLTTAHGLHGVDVVALLIQKLARNASGSRAVMPESLVAPDPESAMYDGEGWLMD